MKNTKSIVFYSLILLVFAVLIWLLLAAGKELEQSKNTVSAPAVFEDHALTPAGLYHPLAILILQIITIILVSRLVGYFAGKVGQPLVIGEIIAGLLLGPSFLGIFFPDVMSFLFPLNSLPHLHFLSQFGLIFFMFIIGMELDIRILRTKAQTAIVVSHASIIVPYFLGMVLAYFLYARFAPANVSFLGFSLFMGIAMSITAFPVLARIIQERGLTKSPLGTLAITCAAADDMTAWCLLAAVIAIVQSGGLLAAVTTIVLGIIFVGFMLGLVQPLMRRLGAIYSSKETISRKIVGIVFLVLLSSAYLSEVIGIHALFGAFLAGVIMPPNLSFKKIITEKIEDVSIVLLLPLFFVFSGLRTQIGLLDSLDLWLICIGVILVAVIGKFGGSALAARFVGQSWKDSCTIGVLMNTRGLMELVVLNVGYDLGILSPEIFTMMVIMALVTTCLTGPGLDLIEKFFKAKALEEAIVQMKATFNILVSFGQPKMGSTLLRLADQLTLKNNTSIEVTALHITPSTDIKPYDAIFFEKEGFQPIRSTAQLLDIKLTTVYKNTEDIDGEIVNTVQQRRYDLVLVGAARPVFNDRATGGRLRQLLEETDTNTCILIDKGFVMAESILLLLASQDDMALLQYAKRFQDSNRARVTILKIGDGHEVDMKDPDTPYQQLTGYFSEVVEQRIPDKHLLSHFNLILVSLDEWNSITAAKATWIKECPSILVVKHHVDLKADVGEKVAELKQAD